MKFTYFNFTLFNKTVLSTALAAALAACGSSGGGGSGSTGTGSSTGSRSNVSSTGVITGFGSVVVNGVHFDESSASVAINDAGSKAGAHKGLKIGMTVKVKGTSDGATGTATDIEAAHEVEAKITSIDSVDKSFVILGQTVYTDDQTLYDGIHNFDELTPDMKVEVYGLRDAHGIIHATLIEAAYTDFHEEVRGMVSELTDTNFNGHLDTFRIGDLTIHYDNTTEFEDGDAGGLVNGAIVEVHFNTRGAIPHHATKIELEDNEDRRFEGGHDDNEDEHDTKDKHQNDTEVEGYVSGFDLHPGTFMVGNVEVHTTATTKFEGRGTLADNVKIEVEGSTSDGVLVAREVNFD